MQVPFADLHQQYLDLKPEMDAAIASVIARSSFIRGPDVERFEQDFATALGSAHCVSCGNGTDALYIAMVGLGVQPGDEVIVPAMSWISTSETVSQAGARPVFCDIDPVTYTLDPAHLSGLITARTVGIIPVHLYGQPADMDPILETAQSHGLWVIEDSAQAHLAQYKSRTAGTMGTCATFSFYPGKNLGAMGDAGAIVTDDAALADRMAMFARHGGLKKHDHRIEGINSRMDGLQAAILSVKLPHLQDWTRARQAIAARYGAGLGNAGSLTLPRVRDDCASVWHLYTVQHENRDALQKALAAAGIATTVNYPRGMPFMPAYAGLGYTAADLPVCAAMQDRILCLPIFSEMSDAHVAYTIQTLQRLDAEGL